MKKILIVISLMLAVLVALIFIWNIDNVNINKINLKLFTICIMLGWILMTLFDTDIAGNRVMVDREIWKQTKGGVKPMIKWPILALRSLLLLIVCLLINHVAPDIYEKLIN